MKAPQLGETMKKLLITVALVASTTANAYYLEGISCSKIAGLAESIMKARQSDVPRSAMMQIARGASVKEVAEINEEMVIDAYGFNVYTHESVKQKAISGFRDFAERRCLKLEAAAKGGGV
jgi:hypothetical protein